MGQVGSGQDFYGNLSCVFRWSSEAYLRYCKEGRPKIQIWSMLHNILSQSGLQ